MPRQPTDRVDFGQLADAGAVLNGCVAVADCERLGGLARPGKTELAYEIECDRYGGFPVLRGRLRATLDLECRRCLQPVAVPLDLRVALAVIADESQLAALPEGFEGWLAPEGKGCLLDVLEEEVLLALPDFAEHSEAEQCTPLAAAADRVVALQARTPFADLRRMISESDD